MTPKDGLEIAEPVGPVALAPAAWPLAVGVRLAAVVTLAQEAGIAQLRVAAGCAAAVTAFACAAAVQLGAAMLLVATSLVEGLLRLSLTLLDARRHAAVPEPTADFLAIDESVDHGRVAGSSCEEPHFQTIPLQLAAVYFVPAAARYLDCLDEVKWKVACEHMHFPWSAP